jgi:Protein of unknown function (DUF4038)
MKQCRWLLTFAVLTTAVHTFAVGRGQRWEQPIATNTTYTWTTAKLCVQYTSPSSKVYTGAGYWDNRTGGVDSFKLRAAFNETGTWSWTLLNDAGCVSTANVTSPLNGTISVTADVTGNPIYANGPVRVNVTGRYLVLSGNASRFHWIGDTSWGGPHRAPIAAWQSYTSDRQAKGFSVIQVAVPTAKGAIAHADNSAAPFYDPAGGSACSTGQLPRAACLPNPAFWTAWDAHIADINAKQMYAAIIGLFKRTDENGAWPTLTDSKGYARFVAARMAGNYTALAPGFDEVPIFPAGDFTSNCANTAPGSENQGCRAREIGMAIKEAVLLQTSINASPRIGTPLSALVTHHMGGGCPPPVGGDGTSACLADAWLSTFHAENWLDFSLVQSGQGAIGNCATNQEDCIAKRSTTRILRLYNLATIKPVINGESIYDNFGFKPNSTCTGSFGTANANYGEMRGRQTAFNTLLSGGVGFTHGIAGTWDWGGYVTCRNVSDGQNAVSSTQIGKLKAAFSTLPWQRLVPDCQQWGALCTDIKNNDQAGSATILKRMYASDSSGLFAVAYLPVGVANSSLNLNLDNLPGFTNAAGTPWRTTWYNPRGGCTCNANAISGGGTTWSFNRPSNTVDWALIVRNSTNIPTLGVGACPPADCP